MHLHNKFFPIWLVYTSSLFLKSVANASSDISRPYFLRESDKLKINHKGHESKPPTITRADLKENTLFNVNIKPITNAYKKKNVLAYVHGFSSGSYNYFLTTEINANQPSQHISKLIRICLEDDKYNSYTEIPIECHDREGIQYNLAQAAFVGTPGLHLAESLNIKLEDDVLFGIFSQCEPQSVNNTTEKAINKSALCIYPLNKINDMFTQNIQNCFNGMGNRGLEFMIPPKNQACKKGKLNYVCAQGQHVNMPLEGRSPVKAQATTTFNMSVKAITATSHANGFTVLFLGTNDGHLIHLGVKNSSTMCEYNRITLDEGFAINSDSDLHFDNKTDTLYTLTEKKLTKVKIPFPAPSICTFEPRKGLVGIGTNITIEGDNLGCVFDDIQNISVAGIPCTPYKHLYKSQQKIVCLINIESDEQKPYTGPVEVQVTNSFVTSKQSFKILNPTIKDIYPKVGSVHGGTKLTITGEHFETEDGINVLIGNISCQVFFCTQNEIKCITPQSTIRNDKVIVIFGNLSHTTNHFYGYTNDTIRDKNGYNLTPKGIPAGGIIISICNNIAQNFSSIQEMIFQVRYNGRIYNGSKCLYINTLLMRCFSPRIAEIDSNSINVKDPVEYNYMLLITHSKTNGTSSLISVESPKFAMYPNPIFYNFSVFEYDGNVNFVIKGRYIDDACQKKDFNVLVGNNSCTIISLLQNEIICQLHKSNTTNNSKISTEKQIVIQIGNNLTYPVLKAKEDDTTKPSQTIYGIPYLSILVVGLTIFGFIILAIVFTHFYCQSRNKKRFEGMLKLDISREMQQQINRMGMETIALRQCIKQIIVEKQVDVDAHLANILKLPNITIDYMSTTEASNGTSEGPEYLLPLDDEWEFSRSKLTLGSFLGEGEFGKVVQGAAFGITDENMTTIVAVKMLKDTHLDADMINLVSEMEIMKLIGMHVNVLRMLGCCTQSGPLLIITEYAVHGNLQDFLRKHLPAANHESTAMDLSQKTFITFSLQVAKGMEYLASMKCVHRDLAARNILVSDNYILKIADFGLARDVRNTDYYRKKSGGRLPIKWMAPEALNHSLYTTQSDVWSFGILLWEIFTLGAMPYPLFTDMEKLVQALDSGYRMRKPRNCCIKTYNIMLKCWNYSPQHRPTFSVIVGDLEEIISNDDNDQILAVSDSCESSNIDESKEFGEGVKNDCLPEL